LPAAAVAAGAVFLANPGRPPHLGGNLVIDGALINAL